MRDAYEVLRQKELEVSRLEEEVESLRVVAPLLSEDGEGENDDQPTLRRAVNDTPQPDHSGWKDRDKKKHWPLSSS
jgi:asparagine synthetase A